MAIFNFLKELIFGKPLQVQFEQMLIDEEARKLDEPAPVAIEPVAEVVPEPVLVPEPVVEEPVAVVAPVVNDQITDAVTAPAPVVAKRAKNTKGKFIADDKSTPDVNEAWVGGKAPAKKTNKRKKK